jgi:hypothetical protein
VSDEHGWTWEKLTRVYGHVQEFPKGKEMHGQYNSMNLHSKGISQCIWRVT